MAITSPQVHIARTQICEIGRRMYAKGFIASNDGNISIKIDNRRLLITPAGVSKGFLEPDDIIMCDMSGEVIAGTSKPSSEIKLHLEVYRKRDDVGAVVHAHPPYATGFAVARIPLTICILPEVVISIGSIPLASYATPSTDELAEVVSPHLEKNNAILLANHGTLTIGEDVFEAYYVLERIEHLAKVSLIARQLGGARPLGEEELKKLAEVSGGTVEVGEIEKRCSNCGVCGKPVNNKLGSQDTKVGDNQGERNGLKVDNSVISSIVDDVVKKIAEG
ncbi:MAG: class II aldolase/adducin family protein [Candidatus Coatesbacteria bacterium]|nr:MAG: class II aldolase/adducin family protein [Candidatus Coatesbacteria bacterium]